MPLVKQVTGHFLQTERVAGVTLKVCFFSLTQLKFFFLFRFNFLLICFALSVKPGFHAAQAVLESTKKLRMALNICSF